MFVEFSNESSLGLGWVGYRMNIRRFLYDKTLPHPISVEESGD